MNLEPLGDRIVVKPIAVENKTESGLILPGAQNERSETGEVVAVSNSNYKDGEWLDPIFSIGDEIMFGQFTGQEVKADNEPYLIMREADVICRLKKAE